MVNNHLAAPSLPPLTPLILSIVHNPLHPPPPHQNLPVWNGTAGVQTTLGFFSLTYKTPQAFQKKRPFAICINQYDIDNYMMGFWQLNEIVQGFSLFPSPLRFTSLPALETYATVLFAVFSFIFLQGWGERLY